MASGRINKFFNNLRRKYRLNLRDQHNDSEVWYMHLSPLDVIGGIVGVILILFIIILTAAAYTPILNLVPGYAGNKARESLIQNIMKVDSIERKLVELQAYSDDVTLILEGKTPVMRNISPGGDSVSVEKTGTIPPSAEDSILRAQLEGDGIYGLSNTQSRNRQRTNLEMVAPARGVIASRFSPRDGQYGVGIATAASQQVLAAQDGTITLSTWSPDDGYIIQIQHSSDIISIYKHIYQVTHPVGTRVRAGEVIAYTGEGLSGEEGKGLLEFELWQNGTPVDPENYIVF